MVRLVATEARHAGEAPGLEPGMVRLVATGARHAGEAPGLEPGMVRLVATGARHAGEAPGLEPGMVRLVAIQGRVTPAKPLALSRGWFGWLPRAWSNQREPPRLKAGASQSAGTSSAVAANRSLPGSRPGSPAETERRPREAYRVPDGALP